MLNATEAAAVTAYCAGKYRDINAFLRGEEPGSVWVRTAVASIDTAIERSRLVIETLLYRGIDAAVARQLIESGLRRGSILRDAAFTSTSSELLMARVFAAWPERGLILRIRAGHGTVALDASPYSAFAGEREVLLPRDVGIRIMAEADADGVMDAEVFVE